MNEFREVPIHNRQTGETFYYRTYTTSDEQSLQYARQTFTAPCYQIGKAATPPSPLSPPCPPIQTELF